MLKQLALETRYDIVAILRMRAFTAMMLGLPIVFYLLFGVALSGTEATGGRDTVRTSLAVFAAFGVIGAALFRFGMAVATERAQGWLLVKRASPMRPLVYIGGKMASSLALCAVVVILLEVCAASIGGARMSALQWAGLAGAMLPGVLPFCVLALAIGFSAGPNSAPGLLNLVHLPGALIGGLWMPVERLPSFLQAISPLLPHYHLGQLALMMVGRNPAPNPLANILALATWTVVGTILAAVAIRRDEGRLYG
jgi:ABC-2 type transport system permease protein